MFNNIPNVFLLNSFYSATTCESHGFKSYVYNSNYASGFFQPEEFRHNYISRSTAQGLCDPWVDLRMDNDFLPKIGSAQRTSTRGTHSLERTKE